MSGSTRNGDVVASSAARRASYVVVVDASRVSRLDNRLVY